MYIKWILIIKFYLLCSVGEERRLEEGKMESEEVGGKRGPGGGGSR